MVFSEALIVQERKNHEMASSSVMLHMAVSSLLSKKASKAFNEQVKTLSAPMD